MLPLRPETGLCFHDPEIGNDRLLYVRRRVLWLLVLILFRRVARRNSKEMFWIINLSNRAEVNVGITGDDSHASRLPATGEPFPYRVGQRSVQLL
jgi:hypothetical protein